MVLAGALEIQIFAGIARLQKDMNDAKNVVGSAMKGVESAVGIAKTALGALGFAIGGINLAGLLRQAVAAASEAEQAENRLNAVLKATGMAAGITKKELDDMADSMAKSTQFDDESIRDAASHLLIFKNIQGDTFRETLKLSADVAAFFGIKIPEAAAKLGKSMEDPETAFGLLKRAGVVLTEQQKDQIKAMGDLGDRAGQQQIILDKLRGAFGGTAAEMNTGILKATNDLTKAWNELMEEMGRTGPTKILVEGSLLSIAAALDLVKRKSQESSAEFKKSALSQSGISIPDLTAATQRPLPSGVLPGEFNDQLKNLPLPEQITPESIAAARKAAAQKEQQQADAKYIKDRDAAKKAADELLKRNESLQKAGIAGWVAYADAVFKIAEDELLAQAKIDEEYWKKKDELRVDDQAAMFAMFDAEQDAAIAAGAIMSQEITEDSKRWTKAADEVSEAWKTAAKDMQRGMSSFFFDVMQGNLSDLSGSFKRTIDKMVADALAAKAAVALFGPEFMNGKGDSAIGGWIGKGLGLLGMGGGSSFAGANDFDLAMADGGSFSAGTRMLVGERGPELVKFNQGGSITPNNELGGARMNVTNIFHISGQTDRRSQAQIAAAAGEGVQRAMARNT